MWSCPDGETVWSGKADEQAMIKKILAGQMTIQVATEYTAGTVS